MKPVHCLLLVVIGSLGCGGKSTPQPDSKKAEANQAAANLKEIASGMMGYSFSHKDEWPPVALCSKEGKPLLSWRVVILPDIGQADLYKEFKLDEPWDSAHNKKLIERMPAVYALPGVTTKEPGLTYFQTFTGPKTLWPVVAAPEAAKAQFGVSTIPRSTNNTILVAEAATPVPWTKPDDIHYDPKKPLPALGALSPDRFLVALCETSVFWVNKKVPEKELRSAINPGSFRTEPDEHDAPLGADWNANVEKYEGK